MISILISTVADIICGWGYYATGGTWGAYIAGLIGALLSFFLINRKVQKPLNEIIMKVQTKLQEASETVQKKVNHFQNKPGGNQTAFMKTVEKIQKGIHETPALDPEGCAAAFEHFRH